MSSPAWASGTESAVGTPAQLQRALTEARLLHSRVAWPELLAMDPRTLSEQAGRLKPDKRPLLVHLWSVYCPPCRAELPVLEQLRSELSSAVHVVLLAEDAAEDFRQGLHKLQLRLPAAMDLYLISPQSSLRRALGNNTMPLTLLLDRHLVVRQAFIGPITERRNELLTAALRLAHSQAASRSH